MASSDSKPQRGDATQPPPSPPSPAPPSSSSPSFSENWKQRVFIPTLLAGITGGGVGLLSKHRQVHGLANISSSYATNFAIVTGCYCGAHEYVRVARKSEPDDLINSVVAGFGTGAILGRLQGGQYGAFRYSIVFAVVGTSLDFATIKLRAMLKGFKEKKGDWMKLPEWSPIQVLDEEALAAKEARKKQLYAETTLGKLSKEES